MRRRWSIRGNRRSAGAKKNVDCWAVGERGGEGIIYSECNPWTKGVAKSDMRSGHHSHCCYL